MIIKSFDYKKINLEINKIILFYGKNEGAKNEIISSLFDEKNTEIKNFDEKEILDNSSIFIENIQSKSLFEPIRIIQIKRASDKICKLLEEIGSKNLEDISLIINAGILEKKSKLRSYFEKSKEYACVPVYPDTNETLSRLTLNFFKKEKIPISQANINLIVNKSSNDRQILLNELQKIKNFSLNGRKLDKSNISKLINLIEDHNISELIDNCLAKNKKKTIDILNENHFNNEDCVLITRIFLNKSKKILKLSSEFKKNNDINLTISSAKPSIFWKDKELTKQQIYKWKPEKIKNLIFKINEIELLIKTNINNSINIVTDFILEQST